MYETRQKTFLQSLILMLLGGFISYYISFSLMKQFSNDSLLIDSKNYKDNPLFKNKKLELNKYETTIANDVINPSVINVNFNDVLCDENIKSDIYFLLKSISGLIPKDIPMLHTPNGLILHGPSGTGKTMLAKSIACECKLPFLNLSYNTLENKFFGESPKILKAYFTLADKLKPCILFIDELDGFLSVRNSMDQSEVNGLKTFFLTLMDGLLSRDSRIIVIGATNRIDNIDPAVKRRMSNHIYMGYPSKEQIKKYINILLSQESFDDDLYNKLIGMSYSTISELIKYCSKKRYLCNEHTTKWKSSDIIDNIKKFTS